MIYQPVAERYCKTCAEWYPAIHLFFYPSKMGRFGLNSKCRWCAREKRRQRYQENRDAEIQYQKNYRENNRELLSQKQQKYRNTDEYRQYRRKYYDQNADDFCRWRREGRQRNHDIELMRQRDYHAKHREQERQVTRKYREENPEKAREATRRWFANHPDYQHNRDQERYWGNPEKERERVKQYFRNHPEKAYNQRQRRRARKCEAPGFHDANDIKRQYQKQQGHCFWCSKSLHGVYHIDHVIPLSRGGSNWPENLVVTCPRCNISKKDRIPYTEWKPPKPLNPPVD